MYIHKYTFKNDLGAKKHIYQSLCIIVLILICNKCIQARKEPNAIILTPNSSSAP